MWHPMGIELSSTRVPTTVETTPFSQSSTCWTFVTNVTGTLRTRGFSEDRSRMVYTRADFDTPPDLYVSDLTASEPVRLTRANPWIEEEIQLGTG